jgi:hypothetical protein
MSEGEGLGTTWCLATAIEHIERIEAYEREQEFYRVVLDDETIQLGARPSAVEPRRYPTESSVDGLLLALRDGYVRATGRRSTTRRPGSGAGNDTWRLHATDPTLITTEEWRAGEFDAGNLVLTGPSGQYIQIQVPDFMVTAIWPDWPESDAAPCASSRRATTYTTPYLELMQEAITHFGLTAQRQEKKEVLSDWFRRQHVEGEPVSSNLAQAMATLIRLPSAQRGGAKRVLGPDLRQKG